MTTLTGSFTVQMTPAEALPGADGRFDLVKTWTGGLEGTSHGLMLTAGDPASGSAGYIASETFEGAIDGRRGTVALQQLGIMDAGEPVLHYVLAPGSGTGELEGATGTLVIGTIDEDGVHQVTLELS
ncbi:DUF3224 domain-containing protein [Brachybacterium sp. AOP43-C2-M15]|uniref:DUF3224 domain-containing protein n=1 Tax=Brachybacterium sp. AOP43-C2-M15 TaxID=3457661 RepID=UPI0040337767